MSRSSLLRSFQQWFLLLALAVTAFACGGRSDEGLMPPDDAGTLDGAKRDVTGLDGYIILPDGAVVLPDGALTDISIGPSDVSINPDSPGVLPDGARVDTGGPVGPGTDGGRLPDGGTTATLVRITIDPPVATLGIATNQQLKVTGVYSDGTTADITQQGVTFSTSAAATATVTTTGGLVTAVAAGMATITATRQPEGFTATSVITVSPATVVSIAVTPATQTIGVGGSVKYTATATMSDGSHQDVTTSVVWSSSDATIASISNMAPNMGLAQGVAAGMTTIKATMMAGNVSGSATLTVTASPLVSIAITPPNPILPIGVNFSLKATATYANGMTGDVTNSVLWASSNAAVGTIGAATGNGSTLSAGTSMITASLSQGGMMITGTTTLTVTAATLVSITVTPATSTVIVGLKEQLTATGHYNNNTTLDITASASWSSSNAASAFVSTAAGTAGQISGLAAGMGNIITASLNGINGTATVNVVDAKLVSIAISPAAPSVPLGATIPLTAQGTYDNGLTADVTTLVTWSTDSAAIATISNAAGTNGQVTAVAIGTTVAHAVSGAISAQVTVTVTAAVPKSLEITPANPSVQITRTQQMIATAVYTDGTRVDVTTQAAWTTGRAATATISNGAGTQGVATAVAVGTTTITATWSGLTATTNITVTPAIPTSISVSPVTATIATGATQNYTAVVIYDIGTQATVTAQCTWSSSNTAVATIALGGGGPGGMTATAHGLGGGDTTITCSYTAQGVTVSGTAMLHVNDPTTPVSIAITPDPVTVTTNGTVNLVATVTLNNGTTITATNTSTWTSSDATIAGVSTTGNARGVVTGVKQGMATVTVTYVASGVTVTGTVTVTVEGTPTGVTISPGNASVNVGQTQNFTTAVLYSDNTSATIAANSTLMVCTSSDTTIATIQVTGNNRVGTCLAEGTVTLTCTYTPSGGTAVMGTTPFSCISPTPTLISIAPSTATVAQGIVVTYTATATFADGSMQNVTTTATWTSSNTAIANVNDTGNTKGQAATVGQGTVTITATFRTVSGTATLTVGPVAPQSLSITPAGGTLPNGSTTQYNAILLMSDNTSQDVTANCNWTSSGAGVDGGAATATVSNAAGTKGLVTAGPTAGTATITATYTGTGSTGITPATVRITVQ